jgi:16S rRNA (guanine527-N7)-methyltransferase
MSLELRRQVCLDLTFREAALPALRGYIELLWSANEELNLISRKMSFEELIDNHIIDCLLPLPKFPAGVKVVADFGSGGGLPAVIYAIQFPEVEFRLYEKSPKKQNFLRECAKISPNIHVHGEIPNVLSNIQLVMARGFKPVDVILDVSRDYYKRGGKYFLLKARREKIDEELLLARKKFKDLKVAVEVLQSPVLQVERHLILI